MGDEVSSRLKDTGGTDSHTQTYPGVFRNRRRGGLRGGRRKRGAGEGGREAIIVL
jgi:hypothetical protein